MKKEMSIDQETKQKIYESFSDDADYFRCVVMQNVQVPAHFHESLEFLFVTDGELRMILDGVEYVAKAGDILFVSGFVLHYTSEREKNRLVSIVFGQTFKNVFEKEFGKEFPPLLQNVGEPTDEIFRFVEDCAARFSSFNFCEKHGFANMLLGLLAHTYPLERKDRKLSEKLVVDILRYLDERFEENITVETVAEKFGYSKNYLSMLFNKYTGMRFDDYVNRLRVIQAMKRLEEKGRANVSDIVFECGFNSMNTFYRAKRKFLDKRGEK